MRNWCLDKATVGKHNGADEQDIKLEGPWKRKSLVIAIVLLPLLAAVMFLVSAAGGKVKEPAVAGTFYPADPTVLVEDGDQPPGAGPGVAA